MAKQRRGFDLFRPKWIQMRNKYAPSRNLLRSRFIFNCLVSFRFGKLHLQTKLCFSSILARDASLAWHLDVLINYTQYSKIWITLPPPPPLNLERKSRISLSEGVLVEKKICCLTFTGVFLIIHHDLNISILST